MKKNINNLCQFSAIFPTSGLKILSFILITSVVLMAFDYDAEYLQINKTYQLNEDGSVIETYHNKIKLHTYRATQRLYGEDFIIYNPEFQELKIIKSLTTMVNGKVVETPKNGYNEALPRYAAGDASLTGLRQRVVTHTGLECGCVVDFEYSITSKPGFLPGVMSEVIFAKNEPVHSYQLTVIIPENKELQFVAKNSDIALNKRTEKGNKIYQWKMEDISPVLTEPNRLKFEDNQPKIVFSSFQNWDELYEVFDASVNQKENLSVEMQLKVNDLTGNLTDDFDKVKVLQNFVANHTGYAKINSKYLGYKIKNIQTTYNENSGTALDKAVLLATMLNSININSYPLFLSKSTTFCDSVASLAQFDEIAVNVRCNGENHLISPVQSMPNTQDGSGQYLFRLNKKLKKIQQLKKFTEKTNYQTMTLNLELSSELKFSGKGTFDFGGGYNPYYKLRDNGKAAATISGSIGALTAENTEITQLSSKKSTINADLNSDELEAKNGYLYLQLPEFSQGFSHKHIITALTERKTTLDLKNCHSEKYCLQIKLPENVTSIPYKVKEYAKSDIGYVRLKYYTEDNMLYIKRSLVLKKDKVEPAEYAEFRKMIKLWENEKYKKILLQVEE